MDPASIRALACTAKRPLGQSFDAVVQNYLEGHRSATAVDTTIEPPANRCIAKDGRGRCRKTVSRVAVIQQCWKHQPLGHIVTPGDAVVCHWNFHNLCQMM